MIYQYDLALPLPTKDLYDTLIMHMALATAKDMYERGEKRIQDIYDKYGDFYSPIASDVDFVHNETVGKLQDAIDLMYANGEDPLRTAEGRAKIERLRRSIDTAAIARKKQAAKNAEEYIKSRNAAIVAGTWNEDYERQMLGGQTLEEWDGSLGDWKATGVSPYKDLNNRYKHLFDGMQLSYDEEESKKMPGWIVKTKSKKDMRTILESNLIDLKSDPQYQYDLRRIKDSLKQSNPFMSDAEAENKASEVLNNEIIDRNHEVAGKTIEADPYYQQALRDKQAERMAAIQHAYKIKEDDNLTANNLYEYELKAIIDQKYPKPGKGGSSNGNDTENSIKDHMLAQMQRGANNYYSKNGGIKKNGRQSVQAAAKNTQEAFQTKGYEKAKEDFIKENKIEKQFNPRTVIKGISTSGDIKDDKANAIYIGEEAVLRIFTDDDVITNTLGVPVKADSDFKGRLKKDFTGTEPKLYMEVLPDGLTVMGKDKRVHQYVRVHVYNDYTDKGYMWYEYQRGMENAVTTSTTKSGKTAYRVPDKPFEYQWDVKEQGYYVPQHVETESSLKNNKPERVGEE